MIILDNFSFIINIIVNLWYTLYIFLATIAPECIVDDTKSLEDPDNVVQCEEEPYLQCCDRDGEPGCCDPDGNEAYVFQFMQTVRYSNHTC